MTGSSEIGFLTSLPGQGKACLALGSPFMARLMAVFGQAVRPGTALGDRLLGWPGDTTGHGDAVALRLAGALHWLVLTGAAPGLAAVYPPHPADDAALLAGVEQAMTEHAAAIDRIIDSPPQTNELRRSATLIAVAHWLTARSGLPLVLSELGASAGLNLNWDRYGLQAGGDRLGPGDAVLTLTPDWRGLPPTQAAPRIRDRRGVDLRPADLATEADRLRMLSYLWPDQTERIARTRIAQALPQPPVDRGDAIDWLAARLRAVPQDALHFVYTTIAWQYFPKAAQVRGAALIAAAGQGRPLAWFGMEPDGQSPGAGLVLHLWPEGRTIAMGRAGFHGEWIDWQAPPAQEALP